MLWSLYMSRTALILYVTLVFFDSPALAASPSGSVYLDGNGSSHALILCHGRGKYPTWKVVDPLRKGVHTILGWHTLSLQMPAEDKNWKKYANDFPAAFETIKQGIVFLRNQKGVSTIYLMGHSMGSRMASAFVAENPDTSIRGLIVAGIRNNGDYPLDGKQNLKGINIPVLDVWGGGDSKDYDAAKERAELVSTTYTQVEIPGANHKFEGDDDHFVAAVVNWLKAQQ
jgi:pimeloyl-ACP methyl ester carboxylesterase